MKKEIAFLIWLYDKELEELASNDHYASATVSEIREKFCDLYGINEEIAEHFKDLYTE